MKKRLSLAVAFLVIAASCSKTGGNERLVAVRFEYSTDAGRFPTKGISDVILSTLPASLSLTLTGEDGQTWDVVTGQEVLLPLGTYSVDGGYSPDLVQNISSGTRYTSHSPVIRVADEVTIVEGVSEYRVAATYGSFAVGVLPSEVSGWTGIFQGVSAEVNCIKTDDLWLIFATGNLTGGASLYTTITTPRGVSKEYKIYTNTGDSGGILAEFGKWYILHPDSVTQSGTLALDLPEWTDGL